MKPSRESLGKLFRSHSGNRTGFALEEIPMIVSNPFSFVLCVVVRTKALRRRKKKWDENITKTDISRVSKGTELMTIAL